MRWIGQGSIEGWQSFLLFFAFSLDSHERARDKWIGCNSNAHCFALTRTPRRTRGNVDAFKRDITRLVTAVSLLPCKWTNEIPKHIFYTISNRFMILRYRHRNDSTEKDLYSYFNSFDDNFSIYENGTFFFTHRWISFKFVKLTL